MTRQNNPKIQTGNGTSCSKTKKIPKATECTDKRKTKAFPYDERYNIYKSLTPVAIADATPVNYLEMAVRIGPNGEPHKGGKRRKTRKNKSKKTFRKTHSKRQKGGAEDEDIALFNAIDDGNIEIVKKLLDKERHWFLRANVDARTYYNDTALINASSMGHIEIVEVLLNNGADVNAKNGSGNTALIIASSMGHIKIVEMLLEKGADLDARNGSGNTALMMARENGRTEVVDMLLDNEADMTTLKKVHKGVLSNAQNRINFLKEKRQNNENLKESRQNDLQECEEKILKKQEDEKVIFLKKQEDEKENFLKNCFENINRKYITTPTDNVLKNPDLIREITKFLRKPVGGKKEERLAKIKRN